MSHRVWISVVLVVLLITSPSHGRCRGGWALLHACRGGNGKRAGASLDSGTHTKVETLALLRHFLGLAPFSPSTGHRPGELRSPVPSTVVTSRVAQRLWSRLRRMQQIEDRKGPQRIFEYPDYITAKESGKDDSYDRE